MFPSHNIPTCLPPHPIRSLTVAILAAAILAALTCPAPAQEKAAPPAKDAPKKAETPPGKALFDGKTLEGWKCPDFGGEAKVSVKDGMIIMDNNPKASMTGITWKGKPPRNNFELTLEGMRLDGYDFFCTTTFPVGEGYCSLVMGGWGGSLVGLSSIDSMDASENSTTTIVEFKDKQWYRVRIRVTDAKVEAWVDDKQVVDQERKDHKFSIRSECDDCRPLGICTWDTKGAVRNIRLRELTAEKPAAK
jgi:hypothetical protein